MGKVKSKLGCVSSLFTCFGANKSKRKKPPTRRRNDDVPESPDETAADGHHDLANNDDGHEHHPTATDNVGGGGGGGVVVCQKKDRGILGNGHSSSGSNGGMKRVSIQRQRGENDSRSTTNQHKSLIPQSPRSDSMRSMGSAVSKQSSVYYDATDGCGDDDDHDDFDMDVLDNDNNNNNYYHNDSFEDGTTLQIDGQYYFSAMDDPTISQEVFDGIRLYPPLPTTFPDPVPPRSPISMTNIQTLLHDYQHQADNESTKRMNDAAEIASSQAGIALEMQAKRLLSLKDDALTMEYMDDYTNQLLHELQISNVRERGFPGELSTIELEAVKRFQQELQTRDDKVYHQIVYSFREVESEAYALCQFLRARKFDVDKVFELLDVAKEYFAVARGNNFYRDLEKDMGVSRSVFLSQYPAVFCGK